MHISGTTLKYQNANDLGTKNQSRYRAEWCWTKAAPPRLLLLVDGHSLASDYTNITQHTERD